MTTRSNAAVISVGRQIGIVLISLVAYVIPCKGQSTVALDQAEDQIRQAVTVGMSRDEAESALEKIGIRAAYYARDTLAPLHEEGWKDENPDLKGQLLASMKVVSHTFGYTSLSIEIDVDQKDRASRIWIKPVHVAQ